MPEGKDGAPPAPTQKKRWIGDYTGLIGSLLGILTVIIGAFAYIWNIERGLTERLSKLEGQLAASESALERRIEDVNRAASAEIDRVNRELCAHFTNREQDIAWQILDTVSATRETIDRIEFTALRPKLRKDLTQINARLDDLTEWLKTRPNSPSTTGVPKCEGS